MKSFLILCCLWITFCDSFELNVTKGSRQRSKRYDKGVRAQPSEWPWQVLILTGEQDWNICGGSLISENWVLTAAHCLRHIEGGDHPSSFQLVFGDYDRFEEDGTEVTSGVDKILVHPGYEAQNHTNDVALIKLKKPLNFSSEAHKHLKPVCLNLKPLASNYSKCYGTGWGRRGNKGPMAEILQKLELIEYSQRNCAKIHEEFYSKGPSFERVGPNQICMVTRVNPYPNSGVSFGAACAGDSGGPLQCKLKARTWYQVGIAWSNTHCEQNPSVYNLVHKYADWIMSSSNYRLPNDCSKGKTEKKQSPVKFPQVSSTTMTIGEQSTFGHNKNQGLKPRPSRPPRVSWQVWQKLLKQDQVAPLL